MDVMPWGGRFSATPAGDLVSYTSSAGIDRRMWKEDIGASRAHVRTLHRARLIDDSEMADLLAGLDAVAAELSGGEFEWRPLDEDVHMAVERRLTEIVGVAGGKLHTARSRNDQVATDLRLYLGRRMREVALAICDLTATLHERAHEVGGAVMPGYTHLQRAQPVLLAHHLGAHGWALMRDADRLNRVADSALEECPLGAGALAGTGLPIDPVETARDLGFRFSFRNSIDVTSSRDLVAEAVAMAALAMVTMSRLAEEIVIWSTSEFGFIELSDEWATGSSMMPQKKNPDVAELARGRAGRVIGRLAGLLATLKGLPLAYNRDLQEDKEALFDSLDTAAATAAALRGALGSASFRTDRMEAASGGDALATDLADRLVLDGMPFRDAHRETGRRVAGGELLPELTVAASIAARDRPGMTGPGAVAAQLEQLAHEIARAREHATPDSSNVAVPDVAGDAGVEIRPFTEDDYLPLASAVEEWYSQPMKAILLRRFVLHFGSTSFVAWRGGERVGFVIGWLPPDRPDEVFVHAITLAPTERGLGTGRMLYSALALAGRSAGRSRMVATIRPHNDGSLSFHRALGFSFITDGAHVDGRGVPILAEWDGPGEDRVVAVCEI